ncbi:hypothetical protein K0M31_017473 [Melipona bicolor]|uniref:Uncharacterized protein n=1 Tax=Melipona bicolor TaxID=60889 RepID=A0AA40G516_9HYME|nr:hypothetical protein K0M31_017473 [Melipona bicolor]
MSTLEEEVTLYLEEYALNLVALPLPREILLVVSCSRSELRASCSCVSLPSLFCMVRVSSLSWQSDPRQSVENVTERVDRMVKKKGGGKKEKKAADVSPLWWNLMMQTMHSVLSSGIDPHS